jgi:formylmethanofuran dehydrogenase subunit E
MTAEEILWSEDFKKCIDFHGHICPGVTIGFQAARVLMERLGVQKAPDEELVAIVENDSCSADAIQIMTGCTFGKGNFIFKNYGKQAFSLIDRKREKAIRVCLLAGALEGDPERLSLFEKVRTEKASPEEKDRYQQLQQGRIRNILDATAESLFKIEEISPDIPPKAMIMESGICDSCGESTKIDLLRKMNDKEVCIPCVHRSPQSDQSA